MSFASGRPGPAGPLRIARCAALPPLCLLVIGLLSADAIPAKEGVSPGAAGPPAVRFEGNRAFSIQQLEKVAQEELASYRRTGRRADADDAAYQIQDAYRRSGYHFADVRYATEKTEGRFEAVITVAEGPQVALKKVSFSGTTVFSSDELRSFFNVRSKGGLAAGTELLRAGAMILGATAEGPGLFVESEIAGALSAIRGLYYERGYLDVQVAAPEVGFSESRTEATVRTSITEGTRYVVAGIRIAPDMTGPLGEALREKSNRLVGKPYYPRRKIALESLVVETAGDLGYPDAKAEITLETGALPGAVILEARIDPGPLVTVSSVNFEGKRRTRDGHLRKLLAFRAGDVFSLQKKRESFNALYRTGLFTRVEILLGEGPPSESRPVTVRVEEAPSREVSAEIGWGSYELLRGRLTYRSLNLLGRGRIAAVRIGASLKGEEAGVELTEPRFLGRDMKARAHLDYRTREEPSFTRREFGTGLSLTADLAMGIIGTLEYRLSLTDLTDVSPGFPPEELDPGYRLGSFGVQLSRDTRNDIFFPTSGHRITLGGRVADAVTGSEISFLQFSAAGRFFRGFGDKTVMGLRGQTGFILPTRDQITVPVGERFFNGGENTVRSFGESELGPRDLTGSPSGGLAYNVLSVELRRRLGGNFGASIFADFGNVSPNRTQAQKGDEPFTSRSEVISATFSDYFSDFRPALGVGLQYLLPVGPARLDAAWNPDRNSAKGEESYQVHFSVGMAF